MVQLKRSIKLQDYVSPTFQITEKSESLLDNSYLQLNQNFCEQRFFYQYETKKCYKKCLKKAELLTEGS